MLFFAPDLTVAGRRIGSQHSFKTPFLTKPNPAPTPKQRRALDKSCACRRCATTEVVAYPSPPRIASIELDLDDTLVQVDVAYSQKLPVRVVVLALLARF